MTTFQQQPERPEELRGRLAVNEQEREQLQTALEDAEQRITQLAGENTVLQNEKLSLSNENARLRHLLSLSRPGILEERAANERNDRRPVPNLEEEVAILNEELQVTTEELEEANAALREANELLESQVAERTVTR